VLGLLALAFVVVPIVEIYLLIQVGSVVGALNTIALLVLVSIIGAWLVRREGTGVWQRLQATLASGRVPGNELIDGLLIVLGGALMLTPGFLTDIAGLVLILPPSRALIRTLVRKRFAGRLESGTTSTTTIIDIP
jgi:UPF0716 protein FxsA